MNKWRSGSHNWIFSQLPGPALLSHSLSMHTWCTYMSPLLDGGPNHVGSTIWVDPGTNIQNMVILFCACKSLLNLVLVQSRVGQRQACKKQEHISACTGAAAFHMGTTADLPWPIGTQSFSSLVWLGSLKFTLCKSWMVTHRPPALS